MTLNTVDTINNTLLIKKQITPVASNVELVINNSTIKHNYILAKLDSNVTKYFFKKEHIHFLKDIKILQNGPIAHLPNGTSIKTTYEGTIDFGPNISTGSSKVLVFPSLTNESLVSIGQLCDDRCIVFFTKNNAFITKDVKLIS